MDIPGAIEKLLVKPVAIFGCGVSGRGVAQLLYSKGFSYIFYDKKDLDAKHEFTEREAEEHSLVVYSPGFMQDHAWIKIARACPCVCLGELDFASIFWQGPMIAITGTNGKTTLTHFLAETFNSIGQEAIPCGNNGFPLSSEVDQCENPNAIAICEVSSYQSEYLEYFSPQAVIWTNFDEDHLDRYSSLEEYFYAKWNLLSRGSCEVAYIGSSVAAFAKRLGLSLPLYVKVVVVDAVSELVGHSVFSKPPQAENYALAYAYWMGMNFLSEAIVQSALNYQLLPHRMEKVAEVEGVAFFNDSKATNFSACLAGLKGIDGPIFWIGGGQSKGGDTLEFISKLVPLIEEAFLIGDSAQFLSDSIERAGVAARVFSNLESAIGAAWSSARGRAGGEGVVVLSPAFSSFDMFKNYEHRGNFFKEVVLRLKTESSMVKTI